MSQPPVPAPERRTWSVGRTPKEAADAGTPLWLPRVVGYSTEFAAGLVREYREAWSHAPAPPAAEPSILRDALGELATNYVVTRGLRGRVEFEPDLPDVEAPARMLREILEHLVESALRDNYSASPHCRVRLCEGDPRMAVLEIQDNAPPLPAASMAALERLAESLPVDRVPSRVHRLLMAKNLLGWIRGRIEVLRSDRDLGTILQLVLPRRGVGRPADAATTPIARHVF